MRAKNGLDNTRKRLWAIDDKKFKALPDATERRKCKDCDSVKTEEKIIKKTKEGEYICNKCFLGM